LSLFKKERFSIRKICGIVGSVLLGSILVAPSIIHASTYHYVEKSALTQEEQTKIQAGIPTHPTRSQKRRAPLYAGWCAESVFRQNAPAADYMEPHQQRLAAWQ